MRIGEKGADGATPPGKEALTGLQRAGSLFRQYRGSSLQLLLKLGIVNGY